MDRLGPIYRMKLIRSHRQPTRDLVIYALLTGTSIFIGQLESAQAKSQFLQRLSFCKFFGFQVSRPSFLRFENCLSSILCCKLEHARYTLSSKEKAKCWHLKCPFEASHSRLASLAPQGKFGCVLPRVHRAEALPYALLVVLEIALGLTDMPRNQFEDLGSFKRQIPWNVYMVGCTDLIEFSHYCLLVAFPSSPSV